MRRSEKLNTGNVCRVAWAALLFIFILSAPNPSFGALQTVNEQNNSSPFKLEDGNYVVIGVFQYFENAVNYSDYVFRKGFPSKYGYYPQKGYYYVYLNVFDSYNQAKSLCLNYRLEREFTDAWVFSISGDQYFPNPEGRETFVVQDTKEVVPLNTPPDDQPDEVLAASLQKTIIPIAEKEAVQYKFFFKAYDVTTHKSIEADIEVVDPATMKQVARVEANSLQVIEDPGTEDNTLQVIGSHFGYRRLEHRIDLNNLSGSSPDVERSGDTIFVDFELSRLRAGDVAIMYNVYFFNNAAVMRPESRYEVNQLLAMLRENENYEIAIHGHTNGNAYGPIIKMRNDDFNFFELSRNNKEGKGSAKKLSKERAFTIQRFLEYQGIDNGRIKIKGWGGKKMIYNPTDPKAIRNVRVEIEIVQD